MNGVDHAVSGQRTAPRTLKRTWTGIATAAKAGGSVLFLLSMIVGMIAAALSAGAGTRPRT